MQLEDLSGKPCSFLLDSFQECFEFGIKEVFMRPSGRVPCDRSSRIFLVSAYTIPWRVADYLDAPWVIIRGLNTPAAEMCTGLSVVITQPEFCRTSACIAGDLGRSVPRQQAEATLGGGGRVGIDDLQAKGGRRPKVVFIEELYTWREYAGERDLHVHLATLRAACEPLALDGKFTEVTTAFNPNVADKRVECGKGAGLMGKHEEPVRFHMVSLYRNEKRRVLAPGPA